LSDDTEVLDWLMELMDTFTARDYTLQINVTHRLVFCHVAWWRFPTMIIPLLLGSCHRRLVAISHQLPTLLTAIPRLSHNGSWSSLYSLSTDHIENVFSITACSLIAREATCPQSCSLAMAVVLSPV
jgi:hypothetical protein